MMHGLSSALRTAAVLLTFAVFAGCSIRERRENCPCIVIVTCDEPVHMRLDCPQAGLLIEEELPRGLPVRFEMPRLQFFYTFFSDCGAFFDGQGCYIPPGSESPPLRLMCGSAFAAGESVSLPVELRKSYCVLSLDVHSIAEPSTSPLPSVTVSGNVCGWEWSGALRKGPFRVEKVPEDGKCTICVPRQDDNSLLLSLEMGGVRRTFALGELLASDGYDWSAPDLGDVSLYVDCALTIMELTISRFPESVQEEITVF